MNSPSKEYLRDTAVGILQGETQYSHTGHEFCLTRAIKVEEDVNRGNWLREYHGASPHGTAAVVPLSCVGFAAALRYCHSHVAAQPASPTIFCLQKGNVCKIMKFAPFTAKPYLTISSCLPSFPASTSVFRTEAHMIAPTNPKVAKSLFQPSKTQEGTHDSL